MRARAPWGVRALATIAVVVPLGVLVIWFCWPVVALLLEGLAPNGTLEIVEAWSQLDAARTWQVLAETLLQATLATVVALLLGLPAAYVAYCVRAPGSGLLRAFLASAFVMPTVVVGAAFQALFGEGSPLAPLGLDRTLTIVVAGLAFFNIGIIARMVGVVWSRLDHTAIHAARTLGAHAGSSLVERDDASAASRHRFCGSTCVSVLCNVVRNRGDSRWHRAREHRSRNLPTCGAVS